MAGDYYAAGGSKKGMMRRQALRNRLYGLLGELPERHRTISVTKINEEIRPTYFLETLLLDLNGIERVPAYFVTPRQKTGRLPTIIYNHAHGSFYHVGKRELLLGGPALQHPPYAEELTSQGYAALCIDHWGFGERSGRSESAIFKEMLWRGQVMWGMMVYDTLRAIDYVCSRADVDQDRLATLGLSMGSTMAWWVAALDTRIKVCVDICCLTDFQALIDTRNLDKHGIYYYVPGLLNEFTTAQINALIAPRPHLSLAGDLDPLTPPPGLDRIDRELQQVYAAANAPDAWRLVRYNVGHEETADMRRDIVAFLQRYF